MPEQSWIQRAAEEIAKSLEAGLDLEATIDGSPARVNSIELSFSDNAIQQIAAIVERHAGEIWISTKDRMPTAQTPVLVYCEEKSEYTGEIIHHRTIASYIPPRAVLACDYLDPCGDWDLMCDDWDRDENDEPYVPESWYEKAWYNSDYSGWHLTAGVTHWMPLPKIPGQEAVPDRLDERKGL